MMNKTQKENRRRNEGDSIKTYFGIWSLFFVHRRIIHNSWQWISNSSRCGQVVAEELLDSDDPDFVGAEHLGHLLIGGEEKSASEVVLLCVSPAKFGGYAHGDLLLANDVGEVVAGGELFSGLLGHFLEWMLAILIDLRFDILRGRSSASSGVRNNEEIGAKILLLF